MTKTQRLGLASLIVSSAAMVTHNSWGDPWLYVWVAAVLVGMYFFVKD